MIESGSDKNLLVKKVTKIETSKGTLFGKSESYKKVLFAKK